jgi:peptidoglycan/LPS O-acetylase OafA/YrhL
MSNNSVLRKVSLSALSDDLLRAPAAVENHALKTGRFVSLEIGRGVAACLVVAYHASNMIVWSGISAVRPFGGLMGDFNAGVDFFFVLSGFVVSWVHWSDIGLARRLPRYVSRRLARIFPTYWVVLLPLIAADFVAGRHTDLGRIVTSIFLLPSSQKPILGVAWSLVYEVFFYVVFGILLRFGRSVLLLFPIWAAAILWCSLAVDQPVYPESFFFNTYNIEFLLGVATAAFMRNYRIQYALPVFLAGITVFTAMMAFHITTQLRLGTLAMRFAYGVAAAMIIGGMVELERRDALVMPASLAALGGASYAIYLVHPTVNSFGIHLFGPSVLRFSPNLVASAFALVGILTGVLFHVLIEKHVTRWSRRLISAWIPSAAGESPTHSEKAA